MEFRIIYPGGSNVFCNKYLEEFKIKPVKQYFSGRPNKDICDDYKIARSTLWGWICKYGHMVQKDWEVIGRKFQPS